MSSSTSSSPRPTPPWRNRAAAVVAVGAAVTAVATASSGVAGAAPARGGPAPGPFPCGYSTTGQSIGKFAIYMNCATINNHISIDRIAFPDSEDCIPPLTHKVLGEAQGAVGDVRHATTIIEDPDC